MKKLFILIGVIFFILTANSYALFGGGGSTNKNTNINTNGNSNINNICVKPIQNNTQLQAQRQTQLAISKADAKACASAWSKSQSDSKSKSKSDLTFTQTIKNERDYVNPADIKLATSATGFAERESEKGRKFVSNEEQFMFGSYRSVEVATRMNKNLSQWVQTVKSSTLIMPEVEIGDHEATDGMYVFSTKEEFVAFLKLNSVELKDVIKIGMSFGNTTSKRGNSVMLTNQAIIKGSNLGANILLDFDVDTESEFKHRNAGGGAGAADATNKPDTVLTSILSFVFGSQRYDENPYRIGHLVRIKLP
ncbi:MAG: hypothetical protein GY714_20070 [Desulfobacterales bacterium]|nr:hypothetical protein [Desulfobacterales bacterium]